MNGRHPDIKNSIFVYMINDWSHYIPAEARPVVQDLVRSENVAIQVVKKRVTRHGDYKKLPGGRHRITVNAMSNPFKFLLTLVHEIAHLHAFEEFGRGIKPHGIEWKRTFQQLMLPLLRPRIFPEELLRVLALHLKNPRASSGTDSELAIALGMYDEPSDLVYVFQVPKGGEFRLYNGKEFSRVGARVKRIECIELDTGKRYLFQPHAEVELIKN